MSEKLPWMRTAIELLGTTEVPGTRSNPLIVEWAKEIGGEVASYYTDDSIPWCALFVGHCMHVNGIQPPKAMLAALSWKNFGAKLSEPSYGCILVFSRDGGGHVGFAVSQDADYFHVLGGNQGDTVNIIKVAKSRLVAMRWPPYFLLPDKKLTVKTFDGKISTNEQ